MTKTSAHPSSYKDPSGFIFVEKDQVFRQIQQSYAKEYDLLMQSGLYTELVEKKLLIPHREVSKKTLPDGAYKIICPEKVPFISYPYEWSFSQLRDSALCTLRIQRIALKYGMSLKDATPFNIQFVDGKPTLIDTLSFETYRVGEPWVAYKQHCEQFLAPLALAAYTDVRLLSLMRPTLGTIPLDLASTLLPFKAKMNIGILIHIILHARSQQGTNRATTNPKKKTMSRGSFIELMRNLAHTTRSIPTPKQSTYWSDYAHGTSPISYQDKALESKKKIVSAMITATMPKSVWDIGANTGEFSRLASERHIQTVSMDIDPMAVEQNYQRVKEQNEQYILPLLIDLMNPTPMLGWANAERDALFTRPHPDLILALALIHHIAIGQNVPLQKIAELFAQLTETLIIEFIPKEDPQVIGLLSHRDDIFPEYEKHAFERIFGEYFVIAESKKIPNSKRTLYRMIKK